MSAAVCGLCGNFLDGDYCSECQARTASRASTPEGPPLRDAALAILPLVEFYSKREMSSPANGEEGVRDAAEKLRNFRAALAGPTIRTPLHDAVVRFLETTDWRIQVANKQQFDELRAALAGPTIRTPLRDALNALEELHRYYVQLDDPPMANRIAAIIALLRAAT